jgi:DNA-binding CsgD family transcriptional regulator
MAIIERQSLLSEDITASKSRPEWLQVLQRVAREFDYTHVTLMKMPQMTDLTLAPLMLESTIPVQFLRDFDRHKFLNRCPVIPRITNSLMPQCWSLTEAAKDGDSAYPQAMEALMQRFGIKSGVMFPLNSIGGDRYLLRFDGDRDRPCQTTLNAIGMITLHAFDVYDRMRRAEMAAPRTLTKRELEVIRWTSQGKTSAEIGQILTLSDHTINAYMNNAIKKLDCVNRTQLVAKAIRFKLIS